MLIRNDAGGAAGSLLFRFNGDSGANYARHELLGFSSTVVSQASSSATSISSDVVVPSADFVSGSFGAYVLDVLDFSNTSKNTTTRMLFGFTNNTTGFESPKVGLQSGLYNNTSAVTSILIDPFSNAAIGSRFSLYGVK
jgi:hypothetical protein